LTKLFPGRSKSPTAVVSLVIGPHRPACYCREKSTLQLVFLKMRRLALRLTGRDSSFGSVDGSRHGKSAEDDVRPKPPRPEARRTSSAAGNIGDAPAVPLGLFSGASWISDRILSAPQQVNAPPTKDDTLINFDACIEACDSLAASSGDHGHATIINGASSRDCSVMVSPESCSSSRALIRRRPSSRSWPDRSIEMQ
jgi:hypothetical protein